MVVQQLDLCMLKCIKVIQRNQLHVLTSKNIVSLSFPGIHDMGAGGAFFFSLLLGRSAFF